MRRNSSNREPIKNTCPDIDKAIRYLKSVYNSASGANDNDSKEYLLNMMGDICSDLSDFENILEELRSSNETLRTWGVNEAERVDELEYELESANNTISMLEEQIKDLEKEYYNQ